MTALFMYVWDTDQRAADAALVRIHNLSQDSVITGPVPPQTIHFRSYPMAEEVLAGAEFDTESVEDSGMDPTRAGSKTDHWADVLMIHPVSRTPSIRSELLLAVTETAEFDFQSQAVLDVR